MANSLPRVLVAFETLAIMSANRCQEVIDLRPPLPYTSGAMPERLDSNQATGGTVGQTVTSARPTPRITDLILAVKKPARGGEAPPAAYGEPHPEAASYPDHKLALVTPDGTGTTETWYYVADRAGQDAYNFAITYSGENESYPIYTRTYVLLRATYDPLPAITSTDPAAGQCLLVAEKTFESTGTQELDSLYIKVQRVYETLPGPWLLFTRYDDDLGPIQGRKRAVVNSDQPAILTATGKTTYEARDGSDNVAWQIEEAWEGNSYPVGDKDFYDDERGAVQQHSQLVVRDGTETGTLTETGDVITKTSYEPFNQFLLKKIVETWAAAGPQLTTKTLGQKSLIPEKYRSLIRTVETNQLVDKDYAFPTGLTGDQAQIELAQFNIQQARLKILDEIITSGSSLTGQETDEYGALTITEAIVNDGTAADATAGVKRSTVTPLGNGKSIKITVGRSLPSVALTSKTLGQKNLIPEKYRSLIRTVETNQEVSPTYSFPTGLSGDETSIELAQESIRIARLKIIEEIIATGGSLTGAELGEYGGVTITEAIVNDGTVIESGYLVITSRVDPLGNGKSIKITASVASYPQTAGQTYNDDLDVVEQYTLAVVDASTAPLGTNRKDITPMDSRRSRVKTVDIAAIAAVLDAYSVTYPSRTNVQLPDILTSITSVWESSAGSGEATESGSASAAGSNTSISLHGNVSADASSTIMPEVIIEITRPWGQNKSCVEYYFFLPNPVTEADILAKLPLVSAWPDFNPKSHTLVLRGQKASRRAGVHFSYSSSAGGSGGASTSYTSGTSTGQDIGSSIRAVTIPQCIHGDLDWDGALPDTFEFAGARARTTGLGVLNQDTGIVLAIASASITPATLGATPGVTEIPLGDFLEHVEVQKYKYGYFAVRARVVTLP